MKPKKILDADFVVISGPTRRLLRRAIDRKWWIVAFIGLLAILAAGRISAEAEARAAAPALQR